MLHDHSLLARVFFTLLLHAHSARRCLCRPMPPCYCGRPMGALGRGASFDASPMRSLSTQEEVRRKAPRSGGAPNKETPLQVPCTVRTREEFIMSCVLYDCYINSSQCYICSVQLLCSAGRQLGFNYCYSQIVPKARYCNYVYKMVRERGVQSVQSNPADFRSQA